MQHFKTISAFLQFRGLPSPAHPLISVLQLEPVTPQQGQETERWTYDFYCIALKRVTNGHNFKLKYGQQTYDYDEGILSLVSPGQVLSLSVTNEKEEMKQSGWMLLLHPDFLWNTPLAQSIHQYGFWEYEVNEALFLSEKEEETIIVILQNILRECNANMDKLTKQIIIAQTDSLLSYTDRFYQRQFLTREKSSHQLLGRLDSLLNDYFNGAEKLKNGLPDVHSIAKALNLSPGYLRSMLKSLTGLNTQQHIHEKLIEKAKERLSTTNLSVSEIAYGLGFEHLQSFSKFFKTKTNQTPVAFRRSFN